MVLSRLWLLLSVPVALAAVVGLVRVAGSLVRALRRAVLATVPVPPPGSSAPVDLAEAGRLALFLETAQLTLSAPSARGLRVAMATEAGVRLPVRPSYSGARVGSFSRVRVEVAHVDVGQPGRYLLWMEEPDDAAALGPKAAIVVSRPVAGTILGYVFGLLALGFMLAGGVAATGLILAGVGGTGAP